MHYFKYMFAHTRSHIKRQVMEKEEEERRGFGRGFGRELHPAICSDCGAKTEVPFKPAPDRPVYCRECYQKRRPKRRY
jgi:CxxC-x17-CxxC domain-containing protein